MNKKFKRSFNLLLKAGNCVFEDQSVGPILSPFLIKDKVNKFCIEFNKVTNNIFFNLILRVRFFLFMDNSFFFLIKGPSFFNLFKLLLNFTKYNNIDDFLYLKDFFDIIFFKNFFFDRKKTFSFILKRDVISSIFSLKNLLLKNECL